MNASCDPRFSAHHDATADRATVATRALLRSIDAVAPAGVVNRTHRVVRQRAQVMQQRRNRARNLVIPLAICSVILLLICSGLWVGLDQYQAAEIQDVASLASTEASRHFLVVLLWFVPVSLALLAAVWFRRDRAGSSEGRR